MPIILPCGNKPLTTPECSPDCEEAIERLNNQVSDITDKLNTIEEGAEVNQQANWEESDPENDSYIQNKPNVDYTLALGESSSLTDEALTDESVLGALVNIILERGDGTEDYVSVTGSGATDVSRDGDIMTIDTPTGTKAQLQSGTDTDDRAWAASILHQYLEERIAQIPADQFLDLNNTTFVNPFTWSSSQYPGSTDPNLDGKPVLVLALTDGTNVAYSFLNMEDLVGGYTGASPINISGTTIFHDNSGVTAGSYGDSSNQTPGFGDTFNALRATVDAKGHVTAMSQHTVKIPDTLATQSSAGLMSAADKTKLDGSTSKTTWWGTSNTVSATAAKVVTCSDFTLVEGAIISVYFQYGNTASAPTMNVNNTGAISIYVGRTAVNATTNVLQWSSNTIVTFVYNGTDWRYLTSSSAGDVSPSRGAGTWYGSSTATESSDVKSSTVANFVLTKGAMVAITFIYENTSDTLTLNINSTGAKTVYRGVSAVSANNPLKWSAGETLTFIYDGDYYRYISSSSGTFDELTVTGKATLGAINGDELFDYTYVSMTSSSIGANTSGEVTSPASTKKGYYPIAITNVSIVTGAASLRRFYFDSRAVGSCKIVIGVQNDGSSAKTISVNASILWVKTSA